jgi:hypothetical protein
MIEIFWQKQFANKTRGVSHFGLAIYTKKKGILRRKKNYEKSNISPCKK